MKLYVIGIGPGDACFLTAEACEALAECDAVGGYPLYLDLIRPLVQGKSVFSTPMRQEVERCRMALESAAAGAVTALVCSGDAGVYGMASLVYELAAEFPAVEIGVIPGISAALAGAAMLGAPLANDFAVISLSDLLTPWECIEKRLDCAASADFSICLYNPASHKRRDYLKRACDIVLRHRPPATVTGIARNIGRPGASSLIMPLSELRLWEADMFSTIFIGNSTTVQAGSKMINRRGYRYAG